MRCRLQFPESSSNELQLGWQKKRYTHKWKSGCSWVVCQIAPNISFLHERRDKASRHGRWVRDSQKQYILMLQKAPDSSFVLETLQINISLYFLTLHVRRKRSTFEWATALGSWYFKFTIFIATRRSSSANLPFHTWPKPPEPIFCRSIIARLWDREHIWCDHEVWSLVKWCPLSEPEVHWQHVSYCVDGIRMLKKACSRNMTLLVDYHPIQHPERAFNVAN